MMNNDAIEHQENALHAEIENVVPSYLLHRPPS